jgi:hypothetical protein
VSDVNDLCYSTLVLFVHLSASCVKLYFICVSRIDRQNLTYDQMPVLLDEAQKRYTRRLGRLVRGGELISVWIL